MCYNCGCHMPEDDMGDPDNISEDTLRQLAKKRKVQLSGLKHSLSHYLENSVQNDPEFEIMFKKAAKAWGQSVKEAKKQTAKLLNHSH